jgi:TolB-like protein/class 3 adenylate cyclase/Tfp pilus assembly protein PilF
MNPIVDLGRLILFDCSKQICDPQPESEVVTVSQTSAKQARDLKLEIAHLLLIDVVGYSKLLVNEQIELLEQLNRIVRSTDCFRAAERAGKLIRIPTGDGMALLFFRSPEEPAQCALEISDALRAHPQIALRMGIHSGPVNQITDVNDRSNFAGAGINVAQRVMDCGDAGHILLSKHVADDLAQYRHWRPYLQDLGECEVKHGLRIHVMNLCKEGLGNAAVPLKLTRGHRWKREDAMVWPVMPMPRLEWKTIAALTLSVLAVAIGLSIFLHQPGKPRPTPGGPAAAGTIPEKGIAVLPFQNLSDDPQNAYFAVGVQDEILNDLARVAALKVISRTSVAQYRSGPERNLREIANQLGVSHILEGSVQRVGDRVRVNAQLIDARIDGHVWGEHYDREVSDIFALESELAQKIVAQLQAKLSPAEKAALQEQPTANLAAYDRYLKAKVLLGITTFSTRARENLLAALQFLDEAVARDPAFFLAYYQVAVVNDRLYSLGLDRTPKRLALGDAAIQQMVRLRPDAGETHLARAQHFYRGYLDYDRARQELVLARATLPNEPAIYEISGYIDRRQGRWEESIRNLERALELDPRNLFTLQQLSLTYQKLRRFADEVAILDRALTFAPADVDTRVARAQVDLEWHADLHPLHDTIDKLVRENPALGQEIDEPWMLLALCERDPATMARALSSVPPEGINENGTTFPRAWSEGLVARVRGDSAASRTAFASARNELVKVINVQPNYARALAVLGMTDAALGHRDDALRESRRAVELLPVSQDAINGASHLRYLAITYTWLGEKDLAIDELSKASKIPSDVTYGQLRLHPYWDSLRGDPRFEKIVASLAPR